MAGSSREAVVEAVRTALADIRERVRAGEDVAEAELCEAAVADLAGRLLGRAERPLFGPMVNATGVVLHTNLGRALLCEQALEEVAVVARGACNLEYNLEAGGRGERDLLVEEHLVALTGAEAATIVNNNAAALLISLNTLAAGREVVVSRGELIEIGGSFRIPDVTAKSGAIMREVGTTNRTHIEDYMGATRSETALYLK
ncbi:MAG: L-seryl-tRNA(Sec) selenium transferase, partial [Candidatus Binatia bacterium]